MINLCIWKSQNDISLVSGSAKRWVHVHMCLDEVNPIFVVYCVDRANSFLFEGMEAVAPTATAEAEYGAGGGGGGTDLLVHLL